MRSKLESEASAIHPCTLFKQDNALCRGVQTSAVTSKFNEHPWGNYCICAVQGVFEAPSNICHQIDF